ncbi:hypothetical protein [Acinetobacter sp.]|uniref:hypothetical protein n=1 Tax=Acinetobacter sp. TaxID=472 RepID=UPI003BB1FA36
MLPIKKYRRFCIQLYYKEGKRREVVCLHACYKRQYLETSSRKIKVINSKVLNLKTMVYSTYKPSKDWHIFNALDYIHTAVWVVQDSQNGEMRESFISPRCFI